MKNKLLTGLCLTALTLPAFAEETKAIDPSDLTRVYTQAALFVTSDADFRASTMLTGAWTENTHFGGFIEANLGDSKSIDGKDTVGLDYLGGRMQYFQASGIDSTLFPRVGFMTDLIHQKTDGLDDTVLFSAGAIGLINPKYTGGSMVFPNVNLTQGQVFGESAKGYMLNLYATIPVGDMGAFLQISPEYFHVKGDVVELESTAFTALFSAPLTANKSQWLMTKLEYAASDSILPDGREIEQDYELKAEIGMKWFF